MIFCRSNIRSLNDSDGKSDVNRQLISDLIEKYQRKCTSQNLRRISLMKAMHLSFKQGKEFTKYLQTKFMR